MATTKRSNGTTTRKSTGTKAKSSSTQRSGTSSSRTTKASTRSTGAKAHKQAGHGTAKKSPAKKTSRCWPGFEPVPGKSPGAKGSCKPKAHQTSSEKKGDSKAAAASKLQRSAK